MDSLGINGGRTDISCNSVVDVAGEMVDSVGLLVSLMSVVYGVINCQLTEVSL